MEDYYRYKFRRGPTRTRALLIRATAGQLGIFLVLSAMVATGTKLRSATAESALVILVVIINYALALLPEFFPYVGSVLLAVISGAIFAAASFAFVEFELYESAAGWLAVAVMIYGGGLLLSCLWFLRETHRSRRSN